MSRNYSKVEIFQTQLKTLLSNPGEMEPRNNTPYICDSGKSTSSHSTICISDQPCQLLKTARPGKHFSHLVLQSCADNKQLCVCEFLQAYLEITKPLQDNYTQLLISYQKPHQPVTTQPRSQAFAS